MSPLSAFVVWRRERLPLLPFAGVALVVARAAADASVVGTATAFAWITALRLCDDIASRERDRDIVPTRAVVAGPVVAYVVAAAAAVVVAVVAACCVGAGVGFVSLLLALVAVEHTPVFSASRARVGGELARRLLVLLKYPAMALLLSPEAPAFSRCGPLYACFVVDEFFTGRALLPLRALPFALTFCWLCFT